MSWLLKKKKKKSNDLWSINKGVYFSHTLEYTFDANVIIGLQMYFLSYKLSKRHFEVCYSRNYTFTNKLWINSFKHDDPSICTIWTFYKSIKTGTLMSRSAFGCNPFCHLNVVDR